MKYVVHNHELDTDSVLDQTQIESAFPELKSGKLEIVDEIDDRPFTITYDSVATLNQCVASLWEVIAFQDELSKSEILQILEVNLKQIDSALKCVES
jgi:hypothetical protein